MKLALGLLMCKLILNPAIATENHETDAFK